MTQYTLDSLQFNNQELRMWLFEKLNSVGEWNNKTNVRDKLTSLLHYLLAGRGEEALDIRGYLDARDTDEAWYRCFHQYVIPYLDRHFEDLKNE